MVCLFVCICVRRRKSVAMLLTAAKIAWRIVRHQKVTAERNSCCLFARRARRMLPITTYPSVSVCVCVCMCTCVCLWNIGVGFGGCQKMWRPVGLRVFKKVKQHALANSRLSLFLSPSPLPFRVFRVLSHSAFCLCKLPAAVYVHNLPLGNLVLVQCMESGSEVSRPRCSRSINSVLRFSICFYV